ncbi:hypothetical protein JG688_00009159 [Phytophthora aleatoria]|uniref:DDE-1 domain-containing protein n=1 Tax=Phytophthora aleatoria TaxID=2496075 RepID=A0A8J5M2K5_9STRA|nr:hypothetical protein JG688_00009159 [Phytophthora aleatoria]
MSVQYTFLAVQQALLQTRDRTQLCKLCVDRAQPLRGGGAYILFVYYVGNASVPLTTGSLHYSQARLVSFMLDLIERVWKPSVDGCKLLLLDSLKTHKMVSVCYTIQQECCKQVEFVPPGVTGICQPMDVSVMKALKNHATYVFVFTIY